MFPIRKSKISVGGGRVEQRAKVLLEGVVLDHAREPLTRPTVLLPSRPPHPSFPALSKDP